MGKQSNGKGEEEKARKVVLQAKMDCDSCRYKIYKAIVGYPGVEEICIDMKDQKVTLKVSKELDPFKLFALLYNKTNGKVSSLLSFPSKDSNEDDKKVQDKKKEPKDVTIILKVNTHCCECKRKLKEIAWCLGDVHMVHIEDEKITISGKDLDPKKVCEELQKKSHKHVEIIEQKSEAEKKQKTENGKQKQECMKEATPSASPPIYFSNDNETCQIM
ncbi:hypothetical protein KP509_02G096800 [Ceratopteris richardii]|uniref:HMA domain-containing protein n=1 Tax=Ceratopteris richardii TaxID=49495 RepID=A0A8T2VCI1_CERRI|nr:hypothetical protein KP509_02G096800 [Ceratopteris richardii]